MTLLNLHCALLQIIIKLFLLPLGDLHINQLAGVCLLIMLYVMTLFKLACRSGGVVNIYEPGPKQKEIASKK
jgi:hypothetical protein